MTAYRRNLLVGVVMLGALVALGWMILKFGGGPATWFTPPKMGVTFVADRADGIADGSNIFYRGVVVGRVISTRLGDPTQPVVIDALINRQPPLPGNVHGVIKTNSLLGSGASIDLQQNEPQPQGTLQEHAQLEAKYLGTAILPPEFADLAAELKATAHQLRESGVIAHLNETIQKAGQLADSLNSFVSDKGIRDNLTATVSNLKTASDNATRITTNLEKFSNNLNDISADAQTTIKTANTTLTKASSHIDDLSKQVNDRLLQTGELLKTFNSIAAKVDQGKGTAGLIINDPKLYDSLVDTAREINLTIADLKRLVNQWETEGAYFRLSK
jgi:phospholipid/cholesterol/gamma-HCH transport system substrate-binding protein